MADECSCSPNLHSITLVLCSRAALHTMAENRKLHPQYGTVPRPVWHHVGSTWNSLDTGTMWSLYGFMWELFGHIRASLCTIWHYVVNIWFYVGKWWPYLDKLLYCGAIKSTFCIWRCTICGKWVQYGECVLYVQFMYFVLWQYPWSEPQNTIGIPKSRYPCVCVHFLICVFNLWLISTRNLG